MLWRRIARVPRYTPVAAALLAGAAFCAAAGGDTVERWGSFGIQEGRSRRPVPVQNLANVVSIDASNASGYALESNGDVSAWGAGGAGKLGDDSTRSSDSVAVSVSFPAGVHITSIGEAENAGMAVDATGHAWAWGDTGPTTCMKGRGSLVAEQIPGLEDILAVQGGEHHSIWLLSNGTVETCGSNRQGQLGQPGVTVSAKPILVPGLSEVVEVSAGERTSCARTASGAVYDWGSDEEGQIGNGEEQTTVSSPYEVPLPGPASEVSCGGDIPQNGMTLALVGGEVYAWGDNAAGQLGDRKSKNSDIPLATGLQYAQVVASGSTSYGLTGTGQVYAWGSPFEGALGTGSLRSAMTPQLVLEGASQISGTAHDAAALIG